MDGSEFHQLCKEHAQALYAFFLANGIGHHDAQDLVQQSLVTLWKEQARVLDGKAKPFLFGIARRLVMAHWRKATARKRQIDLHREVVDAAHGDGAEAQAVDTDLLERERAERLVDAVDQLPARMAQVVRLIHFQERTPAEAAQALGISRKAVYEAHQRAMKRLRALIQPEPGP